MPTVRMPAESQQPPLLSYDWSDHVDSAEPRRWELESVVNVLWGSLALLIYETLLWVRRRRRMLYTPIYFLFMPSESLNQDLATYLGDDEWLGNSDNPPDPKTPEGKKHYDDLQKRINRHAASAAVVSAIVIPGLSGAFVGLVMPEQAIAYAIFGILLLQGQRAFRSTREFYMHSSTLDRRWEKPAAAIHLGFLLVSVVVFHEAFAWSHRYALDGNYLGLVGTSISYLVFGLLLSVFGVALVGHLFVEHFTSRNYPQLSRQPDLSATLEQTAGEILSGLLSTASKERVLTEQNQPHHDPAESKRELHGGKSRNPSGIQKEVRAKWRWRRGR